MRIFYDLEFIEDGRTIEPLSIGMVDDEGAEYYAVVQDAPWRRVLRHRWLMDNVVPHLLPGNDSRCSVIDLGDSRVLPLRQVAADVREFLLRNGQPELWGYYAAYDHVALCQLWGSMDSHPDGLPMWTNDVQQFSSMLSVDLSAVPQVSVEHNALNDARWTRDAHRHLLKEMGMLGGS